MQNQQQNKGFLGADAAHGMVRMIGIIDTLAKVMIEETSIVSKADTPSFFALQDRKLAAAHDYQNGAADIFSRTEEFKKIDETLKREFEARESAFRVVAEENRSALDRMAKSTKRLGDRIMNAARESVTGKSIRYGASGKLESNQRRSVSMGVQEQA